MFSITFPCQLLLFAFKTSPVCDYCVEPEQSCRWGGCSEGKGQVSRRKNVKFLLGAFFFHVRRFFISYVIIYLRCHSSPPDALCLPFRYFFFFLYSLSSASSPSISKAAYLLAELNFCRRKNNDQKYGQKKGTLKCFSAGDSAKTYGSWGFFVFLWLWRWSGLSLSPGIFSFNQKAIKMLTSLERSHTNVTFSNAHLHHLSISLRYHDT